MNNEMLDAFLIGCMSLVPIFQIVALFARLSGKKKQAFLMSCFSLAASITVAVGMIFSTWETYIMFFAMANIIATGSILVVNYPD